MGSVAIIGFLVLKFPVAFEAEPKDSLIGVFLLFKPSFKVSNTNLVSFTVVALSNAPNTFTFSLSVKFLALKILFVYNSLAFNRLTYSSALSFISMLSSKALIVALASSNSLEYFSL